MEPKNETRKYIVGIIIIALVILAATFANRNKNAADKKDAAENETSIGADTATEETADTGTSMSAAPQAAVEVDYTDANGFTPDNISVKIGGTVTFVNKSAGKMWVGVDEHPTHMEYDGTSLREHCASGATASFDQCAAGAEYSFTFTKAGSFDYHNHSRPTMRGVVTVK